MISDADTDSSESEDNYSPISSVYIQDDNDAATSQIATPFDTNITVAHAYMGEMESLRGYCLYEEGTKVELLAMITNTLPCPGYTLPLICDDASFVSNIKDIFSGSKTFALISYKNPEENWRNISSFGVTMDIYEYRERQGSLFIKARGLQRFKVLKLDINQFSRVGKVLVEILPEKRTESILTPIQVSSLNKYRHCNSNIRMDYKSGGCRRYDASLSSLPHWIYRICEPEIVVQDSLNNLRVLFKFDEDSIPKDPIKLSYWFLQNIIFKHELRLKMLSFDSAVDRLYFGLQELHNCYQICCRSCRKPIGNVSDFISMSKEGYISNFCNPDGFVYETITLSKVTGVSRSTTSRRDFSWFPGYAWNIAQCSHCHTHLGWMFSNYQLEPKFFWGIVKSNVFIDKI